jgi:hypothetical protein
MGYSVDRSGGNGGCSTSCSSSFCCSPDDVGEGEGEGEGEGDGAACAKPIRQIRWRNFILYTVLFSALLWPKRGVVACSKLQDGLTNVLPDSTTIVFLQSCCQSGTGTGT